MWADVVFAAAAAAHALKVGAVAAGLLVVALMAGARP